MQYRPNKWIVFVYMEAQQHSWIALTNQAQRGLSADASPKRGLLPTVDGRREALRMKLPSSRANKVSGPIAMVCYNVVFVDLA